MFFKHYRLSGSGVQVAGCFYLLRVFTVLLLICLVDAAAPEIQDKFLLRETIKGTLSLNKHMIPQVLLFGFGVKTVHLREGSDLTPPLKFGSHLFPVQSLFWRTCLSLFLATLLVNLHSVSPDPAWYMSYVAQHCPPTVSCSHATFGSHLYACRIRAEKLLNGGRIRAEKLLNGGRIRAEGSIWHRLSLKL